MSIISNTERAKRYRDNLEDLWSASGVFGSHIIYAALPVAAREAGDVLADVRKHVRNLLDADRDMTEPPIPMVLHCPSCGTQHIDAPEPERGWTNPPHKSHLCHSCGTVWRPADVPTNGVASIETRGERDTWPCAERAGHDEQREAVSATAPD